MARHEGNIFETNGWKRCGEAPNINPSTFHTTKLSTNYRKMLSFDLPLNNPAMFQTDSSGYSNIIKVVFHTMQFVFQIGLFPKFELKMRPGKMSNDGMVIFGQHNNTPRQSYSLSPINLNDEGILELDISSDAIKPIKWKNPDCNQSINLLCGIGWKTTKYKIQQTEKCRCKKISPPINYSIQNNSINGNPIIILPCDIPGVQHLNFIKCNVYIKRSSNFTFDPDIDFLEFEGIGKIGCENKYLKKFDFRELNMQIVPFSSQSQIILPPCNIMIRKIYPNEVQLQWDNPNEQMGQNIYEYDINEGNNMLNTVKESFVALKTEINQQYHIHIHTRKKARSDGQWIISEDSAHFTFSTPSERQLLPAPTVTIKERTPYYIILKWNHNHRDIQSFIEFYEDDDPLDKSKLLKSLDTNETEKLFDNLKTNTSYTAVIYVQDNKTKICSYPFVKNISTVGCTNSASYNEQGHFSFWNTYSKFFSNTNNMIENNLLDRNLSEDSFENEILMNDSDNSIIDIKYYSGNLDDRDSNGKFKTESYSENTFNGAKEPDHKRRKLEVKDDLLRH